MIGRIIYYLNNMEDSMPIIPKAIIEGLLLAAMLFSIFFLCSFVF
jgi:hypothetical protein